jgi:fluoroquinolone transport system permease protein
MRRWLTALRYDVILQARHGFYFATGVIVTLVSGLLLMLPPEARANHALWVPAVFAVNLPITTLFFVAGLILLERDEGTLAALGVAPVTAGQYLATRMTTLITLAIVETLAVVWVAFGVGSWLPIAAGAVALGLFYTGCGAGISARYTSVNELILPASVFVTFLLVPLLPHFGLLPRAPFVVHPVEPALTLVRGGYTTLSVADLVFGVAGSLGWGALAWRWGTSSVARAMRTTEATGGR